jgi:RNA polymerase sigma factor (sigma-70 family)
VDWCQAEGFRVGRTYTGDLDLAKDMWQEALLKAWDQLMRFEGDADEFKAWLMVILANQCRDQLRHDSRYRALPLTGNYRGLGTTEQPTEPLHLIVDAQVSLDQLVEDAAAEDTLRDTLAVVPEPFQEALRFYCCEYTYAEIGRTIGVPTNTAGTRVLRGRRAAQTYLQQWRDAQAPESVDGSQPEAGP